MDNKQILEALQMQPLSEEEKASRHILGRLYGPIATCKESTRNGRKYGLQLWENALNDEIFKEKIKNKELLLELGHPKDREETDMTKACACIPEMPKIIDGDLYAYVDILDTCNGRLLKTLCDYGFVPGISSRGSGDIMGNDEVDPNTFFLETWDIVQLPAVKKARLSVCEALDEKQLKLKKVLNESYKKSNATDKKLIKESLSNLNINLDDDSCKKSTLKEANIIITDNVDEIPWGADLPEENKPLLMEDAEEDNISEKDSEINTEAEEAEDTKNSEEAEIELDPVEIESEDETSEDADENKDKEKTDKSKEAEESEEDTPSLTIGELTKTIKDFDKKLPVEVANVIIDDKEYTTELSFEDKEDKVIIGVNCTPVEGEDSVNIEDKFEDEESASSNDEEAEIEAEDESEEAIDDGTDDIIESLKEAIRQKDALEKEVKSLKKQKTVGDSEVMELKEELNKYKTSFARVSELAGKSKKAENSVKRLQEELTQKDIKIKQLENQAAEATRLTEGMQFDAHKVKVLTERLETANNKIKTAEETEKDLRDQLTQCKQKLNERTILAKKFKAKSAEVLENYIESKASMLGVNTNTIKQRLNENYSVNDIDRVCDELLTCDINTSTLPFGLERSSKIKFNESVSKESRRLDPNAGYDIDDSLLELAGLKNEKF